MVSHVKEETGCLPRFKMSELLAVPDSCSCFLVVHVSQFYILHEKAKLFPEKFF